MALEACALSDPAWEAQHRAGVPPKEKRQAFMLLTLSLINLVTSFLTSPVVMLDVTICQAKPL